MSVNIVAPQVAPLEGGNQVVGHEDDYGLNDTGVLIGQRGEMQVPLLICSLIGCSEVWFLKASTHRNLCGRNRLSPGSVFPNCLASHNMTRLTLFRKRSISVGATFRFYPNDSVLFEEPDLFDLSAVTVGVCFSPPPSKSMTVSGSL